MMNEYLARLADYIYGTPRMMDELEKLESKFPLFTDERARLTMVFDSFLFDHKLAPANQTPLGLFIEANKDLSEEERHIYRTFEKNIYSLFEVKAINIGKQMILKDLSTGREYSVRERTATRALRKKQCIFVRILPYRDHYILSGSIRAFPNEAMYMMRMGYRAMREKKACPKITPMEVAKLFSDFETEERPGDMDLDRLKEELARTLRRMGLPESTFSDIMKMIESDIEPKKVLAEISEKAAFPSEKDARRFIELLVALWNKVPHKGTAGMSPEEKDGLCSRGPQESALTHELMRHLQDVIYPDAHLSQEELDRVLARAQEEWLDTRNPDLDGQSPREVILAERKSMGNPREEIGIRVSTQPVRVLTKKEKKAQELYAQAMELTKEGRYKDAIKRYERHLKIFRDNHAAWGNMGILHGLLLNKKEALKCLHKSLSINPDYRIAKENLKLIERATGRDLKKMAEHHRIRWR